MDQPKRQPMTEEEYESYKDTLLHNVEKLIDAAHENGLGFYVMGMLAGDVDETPELEEKRRKFKEETGHDDDDVLTEGGLALRGFFETYHQIGAQDVATAIASTAAIPNARMMEKAYEFLQLIVNQGTVSVAEATADGNKNVGIKDFKTIGKSKKKLYRLITDKNNDG